MIAAVALALVFSARARAQSETDFYDNGIGLVGQKKYAEAEAAFRQSIAVDPRYKEAWQALADTLHAEGKSAQADAVQKMADAAPASRGGPASALTPEQQRVLAGVDGPQTTLAEPAAAVATAAPPATPAAPAATAAAPAETTPPEPLAKSNIPLRPLEKSALVTKGPGGALIVAQKNGKGVDGIALSQHDIDIGSPEIVVAPDGTVHVAFVEQHRTTYAYAVYHRASTDGGKTWSEAKNLSEDMPGIRVGRCQIVADARGRVYVIWRAGLAENFSANMYAWSGTAQSNLWFRVLDGGKWSRAKPVHPPGSKETQNDGALSYFAVVDAAGRAQVVWNTRPDKWHPELVHTSGTYHQSLAGVGNGLVFQATLDGTTVSAPREIFLPVVAGQKEQGGYGAYCDGLDTLNGYVDAAGVPHMVAAVTSTHDPISGKSRYEVIENGKAGEVIDLPELSFHAWADVPTLLVDAHGQRHVIALYPAGERPSVRDYLLGIEDEPTIIRAAAPVKGTINSFQAYPGPNGRMVVIYQANDTGEVGDADSFVTLSTGDGKWSAPVNITNNAGRKSFASHHTGSESGLALEKNYVPGVAAAAFDHDGHLLLAMINNERALFSNSAFGVEIAGGSTSTPTLRFLKL